MNCFIVKRLNLISTIVPLLFLHGSLLAQIPKGTFRIGPNLSYNSSSLEFNITNSKSKTTITEFSFSSGYYIINNLELSIGVYLYNSTSENDNQVQILNGRAIGPALTYMLPLTKEIYFPLSVGLDYNVLILEDDISEFTLKGWGYGASAGLEYILANRLGARLSLQYSLGKVKEEENDFEIDVSGLVAGISVNIYFGK